MPTGCRSADCAIRGAAVLLAALLLTPRPAAAQSAGAVHFPTSTSSAVAQRRFEHGVAALHNFWYAEAVRAFEQAQAADPDLALAYAGEALAHDEVWIGADPAGGRAALAKLAPTPRARRAKVGTPRERAYLNAVEALFARDGYDERNRAFVTGMREVVARHPDDVEAKALLAHALLRTLDMDGARDAETLRAVGALAEQVVAANPTHPGGLHYLIHAYDTPSDAHHALEAARRYSAAAPGAPHALHMPSHIYLQRGMWDEMIAVNQRAWQVSQRAASRDGRTLTDLDHHANEFLFYGFLQLGKYRDAMAALDRIKTSFEGTDDWSWAGPWYYSRLAYLILETGNPQVLPSAPPREAQIPAVAFAIGMAAARAGHANAAVTWRDLLARATQAAAPRSPDRLRREIETAELDAMIAAVRNDGAAAVRAAERAVRLRERLGPAAELPDPIKPVHELYGEVLLQLGRAGAAAQQFDRALELMPRRPASLLGRARAAARQDDTAAARRFYRSLLEVRSQADAGLPDVEEAQRYLQSGDR